MTEKIVERPALGGLTSLRFFAACYVLLFHTRGNHLLFRAGFTGVTLFFVLSGFILAYNYPRIRPGEKSRFYISRFARIYPLYIASGFLMLPYFLPQNLHRGGGFLVTSSVLYVLMIQSWFPPYFWVINAGGWTLVVEAFFYLTFPFWVAWMSRLQRRWKWTVALVYAGFMLPPVLFDAYLRYRFPAQAWVLRDIVRMPIFQMGEFLIGVTLGLRFLHHRPVFRGRTVLAAAVLCALCLAAAGPLSNVADEVVWNGVMALPYGLLIYAIAGWKSRWMAHPWLQLGGEVSYSIYLLQWVLVDVTQRMFHHYRGLVPLRFAVFFFLAYLSYRYIEKPSRRWILKKFGIRSHPKPIETPGLAIP